MTEARRRKRQVILAAALGLGAMLLVVGVLWAAGVVYWQQDGVPLCTASGDKWWPNLTSDGGGGAIVAWQDGRGTNYDIYAQRVHSNGTVAWTTNGISLCTAPGFQGYPKLTDDGVGGAIVAWWDYRDLPTTDWDIYAQRVHSDGTVAWATDGISLCTAPGGQLMLYLTSDGVGGAIVAWEDGRGTDSDIYAQRVNPDGTVAWTTNGIPLCTASEDQKYLRLTSDGAGGAIVAWEDYRSGFPSYNQHIYAQRVHSDGTVAWATNGIPLCTASGERERPKITSDGAGGAIVTWQDYRSSNWDIYAQRVNSNGTIAWASGGVPLCIASGDQELPRLTSDESGGAIVVWHDHRSSNDAFYAQQVHSDGTVSWASDGIPVCTASGDQYSPNLTSDGSGGAIVAWQDLRSGTYWDIYAQRVGSGFRPNPDGYRFSNSDPGWGRYPLPPADGDYTTADMRRMFGDDCVCRMVGSVCFVKWDVIRWNYLANRLMNGGHCDGMASTSLRFFKGLDTPSDLQGGANATHDLDLGNARRHIAYYFVASNSRFGF